MAENKRYILARQPTPVEDFAEAAGLADSLTERLKQLTLEKGFAAPVDPLDVYKLAECVRALGQAIGIAAADMHDAGERHGVG